MTTRTTRRLAGAPIVLVLAVMLALVVGPVSALPAVQPATTPAAVDAQAPLAAPSTAATGADPFESVEITVDLPDAQPAQGTVAPQALDGDANGPVGAEPDGQIIDLPFDAEFVIVQWDGDPDAVFALRSLGPDGWSPSVELSFEVLDGPDRTAAGDATEGPAVAVTAAPPVWTGWGTTAVTLAVVSGSPINVRVEALRSRLDRPDDPSTWTANQQTGASAAPSEVYPSSVANAGVVTRAQWLAIPYGTGSLGCGTGPETTDSVDMLVVHHTASGNGYTQAEAMNQVRIIQRYHMETLGWCDIGYNFLVDRYGTIYEGASQSMTSAVVGAHALGFNYSTMGISMIGQYHPGATPTASTVPTVQLDAMIRIITALSRQWNINPAGTTTYKGVTRPVVVGHRDVNATSCPGDNAYPLLANMRVNVPTIANDPFGNVEQVGSPAPGRAAVQGWVIDPDTTAPVEVHVYANGAFAAVGIASLSRPDVGAVYPASGPNHGFNLTFDVAPGRQQLCVYAINIAPGVLNPLLGCQSIDVAPPTDPFGSFDALTSPGPGQARLRGWVIDPDTVDPISVHIYTNGAFAGAVTASRPRSDVGAAHPAFGPNHGFDTVVGVPGGRVQVCAYAINVGPPGVNTLLGCRTVQLPSRNPFGNFEALTSPGPGQVRMRGWAIDPDSTAPVTLHVYANGAFVGSSLAGGARNDVGTVFPAYGPNHGFDTAMAVSGGRTQVCVFALNMGGGTANTLLGCSTIQLATGNPFGSFDSLTSPGPGQVRIAGWAIDPDTTGPLAMHVYVNGVFSGTAAASRLRPDVGAVFPAYGPNHGFDLTLSVVGPPAEVCVFALNAGPGTANTLLGCRRV